MFQCFDLWILKFRFLKPRASEQNVIGGFRASPLAKNHRDRDLPPVLSRLGLRPSPRILEDSVLGAYVGSSWSSLLPFCRQHDARLPKNHLREPILELTLPSEANFLRFSRHTGPPNLQKTFKNCWVFEVFWYAGNHLKSIKNDTKIAIKSSNFEPTMPS